MNARPGLDDFAGAGCSTLDATLATLYDRIEADGAAVLATGDVVPDPLPAEGSERWGISAIFRLRAWPSTLTHAADELARALGPKHVVYRPDALHVTLRQFEAFRTHVAANDASVRAYVDVLASFASATRPVSIAFRGLAASSTGVVVKGWPTRDLRRPRLDLHERLEVARIGMSGPERGSGSLRESAHASLAIFGGKIERPSALATVVRDLESTDFGTVVFDDVWLAGYRRTHEAVALVEYGRFAFA